MSIARSVHSTQRTASLVLVVAVLRVVRVALDAEQRAARKAMQVRVERVLVASDRRGLGARGDSRPAGRCG